MARGNEGSGRAPVSIVRPTTSVTSGVGVTQKLVTAAVAFGDLMQGTFGPQGLDKMLYKTNGETAVTNDGAKIVAELLVKHPAAKAFVQLADAQEQVLPIVAFLWSRSDPRVQRRKSTRRLWVDS